MMNTHSTRNRDHDDHDEPQRTISHDATFDLPEVDWDNLAGPDVGRHRAPEPEVDGLTADSVPSDMPDLAAEADTYGAHADQAASHEATGATSDIDTELSDPLPGSPVKPTEADPAYATAFIGTAQPEARPDGDEPEESEQPEVVSKPGFLARLFGRK